MSEDVRAEREQCSRVLAAIQKIQLEELHNQNILRQNPMWMMREVKHAIEDKKESSIREYSAKLSAIYLEKWRTD